MIVDFGLSKSDANTAAATQTSMGIFRGTIAYSAPEQHGKTPCLATDVFAMAVILYEAITEAVPFGTNIDAASARTTVSGLSTDLSNSNFISCLANRAPDPFEPKEAPPSINRFVLKCLAKEPNDRFKDAGAMKEPWQAALNEADQEASPAHTFWLQTWGERDEIGLADFKVVFSAHPFSLTPAALDQLVSQIDADGNSSISLDEFREACGAKNPVDVAKEAADTASVTSPSSRDPAGIFYKSDLVMTDVRYVGKGDFFGGKKDRVGSMTLKKGKVEVHRSENGKMDFDFQLLKTSLEVVGDTSIELCSEKPRKFSFKSQADFLKFKEGYEKTKAWLETSE